VLGKLTIEALPLYSAVAMGGAAITVLGGLVVLALFLWLGLRYVWITSASASCTSCSPA
jgi:cytochrome o ubiquinol oxidase subunit 1